MSKIGKRKWIEFFNEYFPVDEELLYAIISDKTMKRFLEFLQLINLKDFQQEIDKGKVVLDMVLKNNKIGIRKYAESIFG